MRIRWPSPFALVATLFMASAAIPSLLLPWMLTPPPAARIAVMLILATHGYLLIALLRAVWRALHRRPGARSAQSRRLSVTGAVGLLAIAQLPAATPPPPFSPQPVLAVSATEVPLVGALRSGGPGSLIPWDTLGEPGQIFVRAGPNRTGIEQVTGRPALDPVRAYAGVRSAPTANQRGRLAIAELERAGAFSRSAILVVVPTGSGWVDPAAVTSLEYLTAGDLATVAVQYAELPSWAEYLRGPGRAQDSAQALVAALRERLETIPLASRPRLLVYGESLGAIAARSAGTWADRSLLAGEPGAAWSHPPAGRGTALLHADDPVGWWSPRLLIQRPDGWRGRWLPLVSFWQLSGSLLSAVDAPAGHGHHYGAELVDAWRSTDPAGPAAAARPERLDAIRHAVVGVTP